MKIAVEHYDEKVSIETKHDDITFDDFMETDTAKDIKKAFSKFLPANFIKFFIYFSLLVLKYA